MLQNIIAGIREQLKVVFFGAHNRTLISVMQELPRVHDDVFLYKN